MFFPPVRRCASIIGRYLSDMNCNGCIHCHYIGKADAEYIDHSFHYCDIYPEKDCIGDAYKWCEGLIYENKETENFRKYLEEL